MCRLLCLPCPVYVIFRELSCSLFCHSAYKTGCGPLGGAGRALGRHPLRLFLQPRQALSLCLRPEQLGLAPPFTSGFLSLVGVCTVPPPFLPILIGCFIILSPDKNSNGRRRICHGHEKVFTVWALPLFVVELALSSACCSCWPVMGVAPEHPSLSLRIVKSFSNLINQSCSVKT